MTALTFFSVLVIIALACVGAISSGLFVGEWFAEREIRRTMGEKIHR